MCGTDGQCQGTACGGSGQACCFDPMYSTRTCVGNGLVCLGTLGRTDAGVSTSTYTCAPCGGKGQACCGTSTSGTCASGLRCQYDSLLNRGQWQ
jgi:hypothetical protein